MRLQFLAYGKMVESCLSLRNKKIHENKFFTCVYNFFLSKFYFGNNLNKKKIVENFRKNNFLKSFLKKKYWC